MSNGYCPNHPEFVKEVIELGKKQERLEVQMSNIEEDVHEIKKDVKCLDGKFTKNYLNNTVTKLTVKAWMWFIRVSTVTIMGALVTKLFNLW